jgi:hypothetical protein
MPGTQTHQLCIHPAIFDAASVIFFYGFDHKVILLNHKVITGPGSDCRQRGQYGSMASFPGFTPPASGTSGSFSDDLLYVVKMSVGGVPAFAAGSNSIGGSTYPFTLTALASGTAFVGGYFVGMRVSGTCCRGLGRRVYLDGGTRARPTVVAETILSRDARTAPMSHHAAHATKGMAYIKFGEENAADINLSYKDQSACNRQSSK